MSARKPIRTTDEFTHRHNRLTIPALIAAALATPVHGQLPEDAARPGRPNIIYILADDLGYGDLGIYGQEIIQTPNIDRMAREGLLFTQHYSGSTVCAPARATLLQGRHTGNVYQRMNGRIAMRRDPQDITVGRLLQEAGYVTAMIGKSGVACIDGDEHLPNDKGFDHFFGFLSHVDAHRYYPKVLWRNGERVEYPGNEGKYGDTYSGDEILKETLRFIKEHRDGPFFLHLAAQQPHADMTAPEEWMEPYINKIEGEKPFAGNHYVRQDHPAAAYAGMVAYLDHTVGRILDKLGELGIADDTLVFFTSDNGPPPAGGYNPEWLNSSGPLRGIKRDLYEGGIRVPKIAWWPGTIEPGRTTDHISAFWDFVPTAVALAGGRIPDDTDGISMVPTLLGRDEDQQEHDFLYWEFHERGGRQAVRKGPWKAVRLNVHRHGLAAAPVELYNLTMDPGEEVDVAENYPEIAQRMVEIMRREHDRTLNDRAAFPE